MVARHFALVSILVSFFTCLVLFENCSSQTPFAVVGSAMDKASGGGSNGGGYEGKPYYDVDTNHVCSDGKLQKSTIMDYPDHAELVRKDCVDLSAAQIIPKVKTVTPLATEDVRFLAGSIFNSNKTISTPLGARTVAYCLGTTNDHAGTNRVTIDANAQRLDVQTAEVIVTTAPDGKFAAYFSVLTVAKPGQPALGFRSASVSVDQHLPSPNYPASGYPLNYASKIGGVINVAPTVSQEDGRVHMSSQPVLGADRTAGHLELSTNLTWTCSIE